MRRKVLRSKALRRLTKQTVGCLRIPEELQSSITNYLQDFPKHRIKDHVARLSLAMRSLRKKDEALLEETAPVWKPSEQVQFAVESYLVRKPFKPLPQRFYLSDHRKIKYEQNQTVAYVAARMPAVYSVIQRTFAEIARRIPEFRPGSVLDYGSGPGTTVWALRDVWPGAAEVVNTVETSPPMNEAFKKIFQDLGDVPTMHNYRSLSALNRSKRCKHDLVVAAHAIGELKTVKDQLTTARQLWNLTRDMLVIIEPGTSEGSLTVRGIRAHILALEKKKLMRRKAVLALESQNKSTTQEETADGLVTVQELNTDASNDVDSDGGAHVVAPCPHDGVCPMDGTKQWCHFVQRLERTLTQRVYKRHSERKLRGFEDEKYCYVVLRRGQRPRLKWPLDEVELRMDKELPPTGYFATDVEDDEDDDEEDTEGEGSDADEDEHNDPKQRDRETEVDGDVNESESETEADDEPEFDDEVEEDMNQYPNDPKPRPEEDDDAEESTETSAELSAGWGRVIFRPYKRGRHVILDVCRSTERDGSSGSFKRMIFTRSKHRVLHREAKKSRWGDLWPCM